jgi:hypothetical protein
MTGLVVGGNYIPCNKEWVMEIVMAVSVVDVFLWRGRRATVGSNKGNNV